MGLRCGVIREFDKDSYLAGVELAGYVDSYLEDVPVAFHLREDLVVDGARCVVFFADELNPSSGVVIALYGGRPADDPAFDPVVGHKHRGIERDGPKLS